jgi:hypothetical protein
MIITCMNIMLFMSSSRGMYCVLLATTHGRGKHIWFETEMQTETEWNAVEVGYRRYCKKHGIGSPLLLSSYAELFFVLASR